MRVPDKGHHRVHLLQRSPRVPHVQDVVILVQRRSVRACNRGQLRTINAWVQGTLRHLAEPCEVFRPQLLLRPLCCDARRLIEPKRRRKAAAHPVMIAPHRKMRERSYAVDHLVRTSSIPNRVPEIPKQVVLTFGRTQNRLEALKVGVDVGKEKSSHRRSEARSAPIYKIIEK